MWKNKLPGLEGIRKALPGLLGMLLVVLSFAFLAAPAWSRSVQEAEIIGSLLFPSSADWLKAGDLPKLSEERLAKLMSSNSELEICSDPENTIANADSFHFFDVNGDGREDIIYSGYHPCAEGGLHIIWLADEHEGYAIDGGLNYSMLLRLKPGPGGPLKVTYQPGCCGDFINVYCQEAQGWTSKLCGNTFGSPPDLISGARPLLNEKIVFKEWAELRNSPAIENEYYSEYSAAFLYVFVGNILTIVSSNDSSPCAGTLLAYDQSGEWALVVLEASCAQNQHFSVTKGAFIRLGWVKAESIKLKPKSDPRLSRRQ